MNTTAAVQPGRRQRPRVSVRPAATLGLLALVALFGGVGGWMAYAEISGAIVASGTVAVHGNPKTVQHLDGGIVAEISAADGDVVRKGDILVRLDDTLLKANVAIYTKRIEEALAERARLEAERAGQRTIDWNDGSARALDVVPSAAVRESQDKLLEARQTSREGQKARLKEKIAQFKSEIDGVQGLLSAKREQIAFIDQELKGLRQLHKQGNTTINRLLALERQRAELAGQAAEHRAELARIGNSISEAEISILQLDKEALETALLDLRKREQEISDMVQQLIATRAQIARVDVKAPVDGIVHQLSVFTIGGVVSPGAGILQIIPKNEKVEVEAHIGTQFIDEIYVGQSARVRFSAFNQRTTPEFKGTVQKVSPSSVIDDKQGYSYYRIWISVPEGELASLGDMKLVPGMPAEVFIKTRERTALSYLVKPLTDQINRAFREE